MDPTPPQSSPATIDHEEDEWDTDGFIIPSLGLAEADQKKSEPSEVEPFEPASAKTIKEEKIYLGPHGAPPSQSKQQQDLNLNSSNNRKQRFKQKLKEADRRIIATGRENKLENLRELVGRGSGKTSTNTPTGSSRDWLDPHCHESEFEKWHPQ